jgi:hypothetical protein
MTKGLVQEYYRVEVTIRPANGRQNTIAFRGRADDVIESNDQLKARVKRFLIAAIEEQGMKKPIEIYYVRVYHPTNYQLVKEIGGWIIT